jgi:hypothetical protein
MIAVEYSAKESNACPWEDSDAHTPHHSAAIPQKDSSHLVGAEIWLHLRRLRSLAAVRFATPRRLYPQSCPDRSRRNTGQAFAPACLLSGGRSVAATVQNSPSHRQCRAGHRRHGGKQRVLAASLFATSSQTRGPLRGLRPLPCRPARAE